jgi:subtilisin family serine protease
MTFRAVTYDTAVTGATSAALGNGSYALLSGTSMATPFVVGLAALLKAHQSAYTAYDLKAAILASVTTESSLSGLIGTGGVVNAANALATIVPPIGVSAVPQ